MVVHKKVAKAVRKVGKKVVRKALNSVGVRTRKTPKSRASSISKPPRVRTGSRSFPSGVRIRMGVAPTPSDRGPRSRTQTKARQATKPKRQVGPPKVGFRTVKGRGGRLITIKRPRPRNV